ncbi:MAG: polyprenyl synthetase family protein [candidate division Zixibacteria bacterium]|nr:polyprenyl synthetase family protein [candidate division Zixibacteria bacterium]
MMLPIDEITAPIKGDLELFETKLKEFLIAENPLIYQITHHIFSTTGKRLRPATLFLSAGALGYEGEDVVTPAIAIELIHTATLLHDDVIDESHHRRGKETVNHKWTNLAAVLSGDYFFAKAFKLLVRAGRHDLLEAVSLATERVSIGELGQIQELNNTSLSEADYINIITDKTAALFSCAGECGAKLAGANGKESQSIRNFGEELGIAFQIADDLLDYIGDEEKLGKSIGSDLKEGWFTLPLIYSLANSSDAVSREIKSILNNGFREEQFSKICDFVHESGGIDYTRNIAITFQEKALRWLEEIAESEYKNALSKLADYSIAREK